MLAVIVNRWRRLPVYDVTYNGRQAAERIEKSRHNETTTSIRVHSKNTILSDAKTNTSNSLVIQSRSSREDQNRIKNIGISYPFVPKL